MLVQESILEAITNGKYYARLLNNNIIAQELKGGDCDLLKQKSIILVKWIAILQNYLDNNFDNNGNLIPATFECLTADQAAELVAKLNLMVGGNTSPAPGVWILSTGFWRDDGRWVDSAVWNDTLPII